MLFQIDNSFIHLKDAIVKEEFDDLDEYNKAFMLNHKINNFLIKNKRKDDRPTNDGDKQYKEENEYNNLIFEGKLNILFYLKNRKKLKEKKHFIN